MENGTFTRITVNRGQAPRKQLQYFVQQMLEDGIKTSTVDLLKRGKVVSQEEYANQGASKIPCLLTVYDNNIGLEPSTDKKKTTPIWTRVYTINCSIDISSGNTDTIKDIHQELLDLLLYNHGEYTNDQATGSVTQQFRNRPLKNLLIEDMIMYEGETSSSRPSYLTSILTIQFHIYK